MKIIANESVKYDGKRYEKDKIIDARKDEAERLMKLGVAKAAVIEKVNEDVKGAEEGESGEDGNDDGGST
jgi:FKBP-type peptidyl-prolyl cis-trans isomerase 2